eukprot:scaffold18191_cov25-Tisochrysis_lutea.AAC.1
MGGGNAQKSAMARAKNAERAQQEGKGGGGAAGIKSRQADAAVQAEAMVMREKLHAERAERERLRLEKEAAAAKRAAKLAAASGVKAIVEDDATTKKKKAAAAAAALAAATGGAAPKKKEKAMSRSDSTSKEMDNAAKKGEVEEVMETATNQEEKKIREFHDVEIPEPPPLTEEELAAVRASIAEREIISREYAEKEAAAKAAIVEEESVSKARAVIASKGASWKVSADDFEKLLLVARSTSAKGGDEAAATQSLLDELLGASPAASLVIRALTPDTKVLRMQAVKACAEVVKAAVAAGKGTQAFQKLMSVLDTPLGDAATDERIATGTLSSISKLAGSVDKSSVLALLERSKAFFNGDSLESAAAASLAAGAHLREAIAMGTIAADAEPTAQLIASLDEMAKANSPAEARSAACGLGVAVGALGAGAIVEHGVAQKIIEAMDSKSKTASNCRESATLAVGMLCRALLFKFEPYAVPLLPKLVKLFADKDKRVADGATFAARAMIEGLSTLSVKLVVGALYEGLGVVGGGGRVRIECLRLAGILATNAPGTMGPCLPECIPLVIECINDSNAKVQTAAEEALPVLCSCVQNAEVASTLKEFILLALRKPDTTLECVEEVLMTTFCNPMDGTSLAFMMPIIIRGIKDANYELVKKATVCASNLCALVKDSSDIAPFVPLLMPLLEKNKEHSSPVIREVTVKAHTALVEGAGDLVDPAKRHKVLADTVRASLSSMHSDLPAELLDYLGDTSAAMLDEKLGGVVRVQYFRDAVPQLAEWLSSSLSGIVAVDAAGVTAVAEAAVEKFREELPEESRQMLAKSGDKDFALDMQNIILAFAGRVLLRKADVRFQRGHRYGLIGQNGTGKTTLLNRLAAKDINGFPQELRTWYIRHEVLCDDGVDVRSFLKEKAPEGRKDDALVEDVLSRVNFPEEFKATYVNSLSGGWKMRMSVAISMMHEPELLLLDEPTNHLDREAIDWLTNHLQSLKGVTIAVVSHDYDFIDAVCTDITHYDNGGELGKPCRFVYYPMTFSEFQRLKPEIAAGLPRVDHAPFPTGGTPSEASEAAPSVDGSTAAASATSDSQSESAASGLSATFSKVDEMIAAGLILPMNFPDPGKPEGIRTFRKPVMTLKQVSFKYPETDRYILQDVDATLTLGSRAVIVGGNGSGKSTFLKLLIGDLEPEDGKGETWKHHALRLSYVAQQSLHHLEDHVTSTPIQYIQARFRQGLDAEVAKLKTIALTDEEKAMMDAPSAIYAIVGRTSKGNKPWYEFQQRGKMKQETQTLPLTEITMRFPPYVQKLIKNYDQKAQAIESGMAIRPITEAEVLKHLADFGIDQQLAFGKIRQMSGGQRQRLVICAAFWSKPHVIALDEPTNYLDNDSVAALTKALKDFKGAVVTVSENEAFVAEISNEKWVVEDGKVQCLQLRSAKAR